MHLRSRFLIQSINGLAAGGSF